MSQLAPELEQLDVSVEAVAGAIEGRSPWQLAWVRLRRDHVAIVCAVVIVAIALFGILAPLVAYLTGHPPNAQYLDVGLTPQGLPKAPTWHFLFGTDDLGRDVLVRVAYGARISLLAGVVASTLAVAIGVVFGITAAYFGGVVDSFLSRTIDVILSFPFLLFGIALVSLVGPSLWIAIAIIVFFSWAAVGRIVRGQTLSLREKEFVEAARSLGASDRRIMFVDIFPNLLPPVLVYLTLLIPAAIAFEATLSFFALGVVPPTPSWGNMLSESLGFYRVAWWLMLFPGLLLLATTLSFNLLGDSVRDAFDPRGERLFRR